MYHKFIKLEALIWSLSIESVNRAECWPERESARMPSVLRQRVHFRGSFARKLIKFVICNLILRQKLISFGKVTFPFLVDRLIDLQTAEEALSRERFKTRSPAALGGMLVGCFRQNAI